MPHQTNKNTWPSPIVLMTKATGALRICVDYRNVITVSDGYRIPRISDIFEIFWNTSFFSSFDLSKYYWQVPLSADTSERSAFLTIPVYWHALWHEKPHPPHLSVWWTKSLMGWKLLFRTSTTILFSSTLLSESKLTIGRNKCTVGVSEIKCLYYRYILNKKRFKTAVTEYFFSLNRIYFQFCKKSYFQSILMRFSSLFQ